LGHGTLAGAARESLETVVASWYGTRGMSLPTPNLAKPGEATLTDDRRKYILDGDGKGGGGHGPGRGTPGKSEFPSVWSDEKTIEAIKEVANDPASARAPSFRGRTVVRGTRDGVDIEVVVGADGKTVVSAFPTNVRRNPTK
jgi:hypothetical protein